MGILSTKKGGIFLKTLRFTKEEKNFPQDKKNIQTKNALRVS